MQTLLITGANRGLGLEFVRQYAADGWRVLACCRVPGEADELRTLAAASIDIHALDVADFAAIDALAARLHDTPIDLLLNNAGIYPDHHGGFGDTDYAAWQRAYLVNSMAPLKMAEAFVRHLEQGSGKLIASVSSKMGSVADNTSGGAYLYRSSKSALNMVMKSLALDLAPRGIVALTLHPGWVLTDMGGPNALITPEQSIAGMRKVLARATAADAGRFLSFNGDELPW
jgi:NAD(P)-dependent dehydrogenase (short-subunit alcohol dehydrogenase family)